MLTKMEYCYLFVLLKHSHNYCYFSILNGISIQFSTFNFCHWFLAGNLSGFGILSWRPNWKAFFIQNLSILGWHVYICVSVYVYICMVCMDHWGQKRADLYIWGCRSHAAWVNRVEVTEASAAFEVGGGQCLPSPPLQCVSYKHPF